MIVWRRVVRLFMSPYTRMQYDLRLLTKSKPFLRALNEVTPNE